MLLVGFIELWKLIEAVYHVCPEGSGDSFSPLLIPVQLSMQEHSFKQSGLYHIVSLYHMTECIMSSLSLVTDRYQVSGH